MAILEIIHPIVGLVKTSVITTMFQGIGSDYTVAWTPVRGNLNQNAISINKLMKCHQGYLSFGGFWVLYLELNTQLVLFYYWLPGQSLKYYATGDIASLWISYNLGFSYYAFSQLNMAPYVLTYLRYTLFIVLYPIGVTGEIMSIIRFVQKMAFLGNNESSIIYRP